MFVLRTHTKGALRQDAMHLRDDLGEQEQYTKTHWAAFPARLQLPLPQLSSECLLGPSAGVTPRRPPQPPRAPGANRSLSSPWPVRDPIGARGRRIAPELLQAAASAKQLGQRSLTFSILRWSAARRAFPAAATASSSGVPPAQPDLRGRTRKEESLVGPLLLPSTLSACRQLSCADRYI